MPEPEWKTEEAPRLLAMTPEELDAYYAKEWGWGTEAVEDEDQK